MCIDGMFVCCSTVTHLVAVLRVYEDTPNVPKLPAVGRSLTWPLDICNEHL